MAKNKNVTLRDVAKHIGVSAMTVSRALSGKPHLVSPDTAQRCQQAAAEMGYVPNLMARSLRGEQLQTIVLFAEFLAGRPYLAELIEVSSHAIEARDYSVITCQSLKSFHQALRQFRLSGALVIAPPQDFYNDPFGESRIGPVSVPPVVIIHSDVEQDRFNEVSPDISRMCYDTANHLLKLGHRRIAFIGGPSSNDEPQWFSLRRAGLVRALEEHNLTPDAAVRYACHNPDNAKTAMKRLRTQSPDATAILCINDEIGVAVVRAAQESGLRIPNDLSVVGCDDIHFARYFRPRLTTVSIDADILVRAALDILFDEIQANEQTSGEPMRIRMRTNLIIRDTTAPPP